MGSTPNTITTAPSPAGHAGPHAIEAGGLVKTYGETRARVRTFQEDGEAYVRENPTKAVLTAVVAGFVLALLFRR